MVVAFYVIIAAMKALFDLLSDQLHSQIVGGGLVLLFTGSVIALLRKVPTDLLAWMKRRVTVEVEILNSDPLFDYVTLWLSQQPYSQRSRRLTATTASRIGKEDSEGAPVASCGEENRQLRVFLSPAPGSHLFLYNGNFVKLQRNREKPTGAGGDRTWALREHETYTLTMLGKNQNVIRRLVEDIVVAGSSSSDYVRLFTSSWGYWNSDKILRPRKLNTVVLPQGIAEGILHTARDFLSKADWYREVGIPWHCGFLLHGVPGSGKTSVVSALAGELGMDLYLLSLSSGMNDERLFDLMSKVRSGTIVLMEDVDCTFPSRDEEKARDRVTLSGLLNCLDGVQSRDGCMIFMTTNRIEALDPALLRPGRVDHRIEFGYATDEQILRLRDRLNPSIDNGNVLSQCRGRTMADVQQYLLHPDRRALAASNSTST